MTTSSAYLLMTQSSSYSKTYYTSLNQQSTLPNHFIEWMTIVSISQYFLRWIIYLFMLFLTSRLLCRLVGWSGRFISGGWVLVMIGLVLGVFMRIVVVIVVRLCYSHCCGRLQYDSVTPWSIISTQCGCDSSLSYCSSKMDSSSYSATNSAGPWSQIFFYVDETLTYHVDVIILHSTINAELTFLYWTIHHKIGSICCQLC